MRSRPPVGNGRFPRARAGFQPQGVVQVKLVDYDNG
jgi:hypothetical protein